MSATNNTAIIDFGQQLQRLRIQAGIKTQKELAIAMRVQQQTC